ncbi:thermonuclease family protein [Cereibacter sphaeroides]|uniref:thermonuclease family protein n=1 Tax=Cereibacter sphaeroides TaxID=1063 RepID=UPI001F439A98|nr:thermonuclease family protein [Cereibacter sphaeroides]MCE6959660.1 thermonuclease family protein [Cereibacter sphaeroides]MCE6974479.1 thermonuclease family protein [Cereibacter sphaeroides]
MPVTIRSVPRPIRPNALTWLLTGAVAIAGYGMATGPLVLRSGHPSAGLDTALPAPAKPRTSVLPAAPAAVAPAPVATPAPASTVAAPASTETLPAEGDPAVDEIWLDIPQPGTLSPELKEAFSTVDKAHRLMGGTGEAVQPAALAEEASARIGYVPAVPSRAPAGPVFGAQGEAAADISRIVTGKPGILRGDSLRLEGIEIRLDGVRAPGDGDSCAGPKGQRYDCAAWAAEALTTVIGQHDVSCDLVEIKAGEPVSGWCHLHLPGGETVDLAAWMTSAGAALVGPGGREDYIALQREAYLARSGIWSGSVNLATPVALDDLP